MKHYRYGKFRFQDYWQSWMSIAILLFFAIACFFLRLSFVFVVFPIVYAVIWIWTILSPWRERFIINSDNIISYVGKKEHIIELPSELTLVISYVDICPPFAVRTAIGNRTHILKDRYAVSILHEIPLKIALENLHSNYLKIYTTSTVQRVFRSHQYIYSFACNQSLLSKLIESRQCQFIVPESLYNRVSADLDPTNIYVDENC